jgi:hypothetical protein
VKGHVVQFMDLHRRDSVMRSGLIQLRPGCGV